MGVPNKMKSIPVEEVVRMLNEEVSMPKVARRLNMTDSGLFRYMQKNNIEKRVEWFWADKTATPT